MSSLRWIYLLLIVMLFSSCGTVQKTLMTEKPNVEGMEGLEIKCEGSDTIWSILIKKAEAILTYDQERYEVNLTLYSKKDSIIYLSAVNSGFEILRAAVTYDSIKVIDRMNKIVYHTPLHRRWVSISSEF